MYDWLNHCKMPEIHEINHLSIFPTVTRIRDVNHQAFFLWADEVAKKVVHYPLHQQLFVVAKLEHKITIVSLKIAAHNLKQKNNQCRYLWND